MCVCVVFPSLLIKCNPQAKPPSAVAAKSVAGVSWPEVCHRRQFVATYGMMQVNAAILTACAASEVNSCI